VWAAHIAFASFNANMLGDGQAAEEYQRMARPRHEDAPVLPTPKLMAHAKELLRHLDEDSARFVLWDKDCGPPIELSEEIFDLLRHILIDLSQNRAVQILPHNMELTTVQAAEFLQVSRPYLIKLIDEKKIPCRMVGTHRRIRLIDLIEYRDEAARASKTAREEITKEAEKYGWGY
jgi:excisionase family DNA binding protein